MNVDKIWLLSDLIGTNKILFKIPVYQRNYDWSEDNCVRLVNDVQKIVEIGEKHFLGTIVYMETKASHKLREDIIIDGQQRLTTLMICLKALADLSKETEPDVYDEIVNEFLNNTHCSEEYKIKLKPIKTDDEQFVQLLKDDYDNMDEYSHIKLNYDVIKNKLSKILEKGFSCGDILDALNKLEVVEIELIEGEDDPQIIFESINSTGLDLSNSDLIRNFLLMSDTNQDKLYEDYWLKIEQGLRLKNDYRYLELFFQQYIIFKTSQPINSKRLYDLFVKLFKDSNFTHEDCLKELLYYSTIFKTFINENNEYSEKTNKLLRNIRQLDQTTCYPFLLNVFNDYKNNVIDEKVLENILHLLLTYLVRRLVCGVPSNSLRGLFTYLYNRIFKVESNKKRYYETINKYLFTLTTKDRMPSDQLFEESLKHNNLYNMHNLCRFILTDIENGDGKEKIAIDNLTIEHIMPQTINVDWSHINVDDHVKYLHTLGNLSVTGYNSELSNKSFEDKKNIIKQHSKANVLNQDVIDKNSWGVKEIENRANRLAKIVKDRYTHTIINDNSIEFDYIKTITLNQYNDVTGKRMVSFKFNNDVYRQNKFALMLLDVLKIIDNENHDKLLELAITKYSISKTAKPSLSTDEKDLRWALKVSDDIYMEGNLSASRCVYTIKLILEKLNIDISQFTINIIEENEDDE